MAEFNWAAAIKSRPGGDTRAQLVNAYGDPVVGSKPHPTDKGWFIPSAAWEQNNLVGIMTADLPGFPLFGDIRVEKIKMHKTVAPVFIATWSELVRLGLNTKFRVYSGCYAPRHMGYDVTRPPSVHAYGAAIDFDAPWNGYGVPLERMQMNRDIVEVFERMGWHWGGRWDGGYADGMHFQWTDPLINVPRMSWQDAGPASIITPAPPVTSIVVPAARRILIANPKGEWVNTTRRKSTIKNAKGDVSVIVDDTSKDGLIVEVEANGLYFKINLTDPVTTRGRFHRRKQ